MRQSKLGRLIALCSATLGGSGLALAVGPDVIVGDLYGVDNFGAVGGIRAYAVATESCNIGTEDLLWESWNNRHPVIGQNMYRLKNGRFEHIGQSWLKHAFTALTLELCGGPCNGHGGSVLGVGCSDPYSASLNGQQSRLGPRSEVNATTGEYPYPYGIGWNQSGDAIYKRLQCYQTDLANSGALYFVEGQYVTEDDAASFNKDNNASYRRVTISSSTYNVTMQGTTQRMKPAIQAWYDNGGGVGIPDNNVKLAKMNDEDGGTFWLAYKVSDLGGGWYHYEYAVQNLNSHLSGGSFSVPVQEGTQVANMEFHAPFYHSGEPYDNTAWTVPTGIENGALTWTSPQTYAENPNSNALRWGTLYNFRFDASRVNGMISLGLFRPATNSTLTRLASVPSVTCGPDLDGDGAVGLADLSIMLTYFGGPGGPAEGDLDGNGIVDLADLSSLLELYGGSCP